MRELRNNRFAWRLVLESWAYYGERKCVVFHSGFLALLSSYSSLTETEEPR
jgi:hypothetical protein